MTERDEQPQRAPTTSPFVALSSPGPVGIPAVTEPILLDVPLVTFVLDGLGAFALFATVAAVSGVREGAVMTSVVGVYVLSARMLRSRRASSNTTHAGRQP